MLTKRQKKCHRFICRFIREHELSPTLQEITDGMGCTAIATGARYVAILERSGHIKRTLGRHGSIRVLKEAA